MSKIMNSANGVKSYVLERVSISCPTCCTRHDLPKTTGKKLYVTVSEYMSGDHVGTMRELFDTVFANVNITVTQGILEYSTWVWKIDYREIKVITLIIELCERFTILIKLQMKVKIISPVWRIPSEYISAI